MKAGLMGGGSFGVVTPWSNPLAERCQRLPPATGNHPGGFLIGSRPLLCRRRDKSIRCEHPDAGEDVSG